MRRNAGRNPVRRKRLQVSGERLFERNVMASRCDSNRDRIGEGSAPDFSEIVESFARPGCLRDIEKCAALRRCLEKTLARWRQGCRKLGDLTQCVVVARRTGAIGLREKDSVAITRAIREQTLQPAG
jgi:hypothetical protein